MNIIKPKALDTWKSCAGLCVLCGTPLSLEKEGRRMKENLRDEDLVGQEEEQEEEQDSEHVQENFVRVMLFKYNLLGKVEKCHVIDRYTFLNSWDGFQKALRENENIMLALGGNLGRDVDVQVFNKAADYCQRVAAKVVVPCCSQCNAAMNHSAAHADVVYRCFPPSAQLNLPELEDSLTKTGRVVSKGIVIKKLIQQVALYFNLQTKDQTWHARDEDEIMGLAALWRCVCNLCMWGRSATVRFRLIAIFYGSVYIYERLRLHDVMLFTDWHMHVFRCPSLLKKGGLGIIPLHVCRVHYMEQHTPGTFFGMTHPRAAVTFNTTLKAGQVWCDVVREVLQRAADSVDIYFRDRVVLAKIFAFKNLLTQQVNSEKGLFCFLSRYGPLRAFAKGKLKREGAGALG